MTHFHVTGGNTSYIDYAIIRYYIDGETTPSIVFQPALAAGVGFGDDYGPWGNEYIGHGVGPSEPGLYRDISEWFINIRVPFKNSLRATIAFNTEHYGDGDKSTFISLRGAVGIPIQVGGITIPSGAKMVLQTNYNVPVKAL